MTYKLLFHELALKEWNRLDKTIQTQFKKKLGERLENPHVPSSALRNIPNSYKIKLRSAGYRLIYSVDDSIITVKVIAVGKRDKLEAYNKAQSRI